MRIETGNDIRAERARRGLNRAAFCRISGISRDLLRILECGGCLPTQETIDKARTAFEQFDNRQVAA
jgi:transcriptional regulator with XRE-family HTH domain